MRSPSVLIFLFFVWSSKTGKITSFCSWLRGFSSLWCITWIRISYVFLFHSLDSTVAERRVSPKGKEYDFGFRSAIVSVGKSHSYVTHFHLIPPVKVKLSLHTFVLVSQNISQSSFRTLLFSVSSNTSGKIISSSSPLWRSSVSVFSFSRVPMTLSSSRASSQSQRASMTLSFITWSPSTYFRLPGSREELTSFVPHIQR